MAFVNGSLLIGGLLIAIPVVIHLAMRKTPKPLIFPALRFVQQRKVTNQRRLQWRQWLLLLLRCLVLGLLAFAFARPSAASEVAGSWTMAGVLGLLLLLAAPAAWIAWRQQRGRLISSVLTSLAVLLALFVAFFVFSAVRRQPPAMLGDQEAPVAAVLIFDTSPRMQYRRQNQTRIEQAQQTAQWLIEQLPKDSQLAVLDSQMTAPVFSVDLAAGAKAVQRLESAAAPRPLGQLISDGLRLLDSNERDRKEIYVFTDLTEAAWRGAQSEVALEDHPDVGVYVVDVGVENPENLALGAITMNSQVVARNSPLELQVDVRSIGLSAARQVELLVEQLDPTLPIVEDDIIRTPQAQQRGRQEVSLEPGQATSLRFRLEESKGGVRHGRIRLLGEDGLAIDDTRHFAFRVDEAWPVLIIAPDNAWSVFFTQSVAPDAEREQGKNRYEISEIRQLDLDTERFEDYAAVCLLDPKPLNADQWTRLGDYVERGGSLGVFLGRNASQRESFNTKAAQRVLAAPLSTQWRAGGRKLFVNVANFNHPITRLFQATATSTPWNRFPVEKHWSLGELQANVQTIVPFTSGNACLLDKPLGRGRVVMMTTPLSEPSAGPQRRSPWNELASGLDNWPPFLLANTTLQYLVASGDVHLNYETGETAALPNSPSQDPERYQMFLPTGPPFEVRPQRNQIVAAFTDLPGAYRLKGVRGGPVIRGFAVNWPSEASNLERMEASKLDSVFGEGKYQFASRRDEIERVQGAQRVGREFYPLLMFVAALVLGIEQLLANRFYPPERGGSTSPNSATRAAPQSS
jgi:hypothetical protein